MTKFQSYLEAEKLVEPFVPYDKSWFMRVGMLDQFYGFSDTIEFLEQSPGPIGSDLQALVAVSRAQLQGKTTFDVGESATLKRFKKYEGWLLGIDYVFIEHGTLPDRPMADDPAIVDKPLFELLTLDNCTSQWASAAVLYGNTEPMSHYAPYKLRLTYKAAHHWYERRADRRIWQPRKDPTITRQAVAYALWKHNGLLDFKPEQSEDYPFARVFGVVTPEQGEARWPALRGHESDRITTVEMALKEDIVSIADHRVIQAAVMRRNLSYDQTAHPEAVAKSWPLFWEFKDFVDNL